MGTLRVFPRKPDPNEKVGPDPEPCSICGKTGHWFYDQLACLDRLIAEVEKE